VAPPKVTIQCHCGDRLLVPYGQRQTCACGRTWNTNQIPATDFAALRATVRRFRRNEIAFLMVALGLAGTLYLVGRSAPVLIAAPVFVLVWLRWFRPWWKLRKQAKLKDLPVWDLTPETGPATH
jgi:hypothetical protein